MVIAEVIYEKNKMISSRAFIITLRLLCHVRELE
jgi:hypothetical protein